MQPDSRSGWVDLAKGMGIFLVVYGHINWGLCSAALTCNLPVQTVLHSVLYLFHMPLFFFLSGMFLPHSLRSQRGPAGVVTAKVNTIVYPYVIWSLLQGGIAVAFSRFKNHPTTLADVLSFPWQPYMQLWFIYCLFLCFATTAWLFHVLPERHRLWLMVPAMVLYAFKAQFQPIYSVLYDYARSLPFFLMGALLATPMLRMALKGWPIVALTTTVAVALQYLFHGVLGLDTEHTEHWLKFPAGLACVLAVIAWCQTLSGYPLRWLASLGAASFAIYLMHEMFAVVVRTILARGLHVQHFELHSVLGTLAGLLIPIALLRHGGRWISFLFEPPRALALRLPSRPRLADVQTTAP